MRTLMYAGKPLSDFHVVWDGSKEFDKPKKIANTYTIPYRNGNLIKSTESFENVSISYPCFIRENFEENYSELVNYLNSFDTYQRLESTEEPSIYRMAFLHSVITPKTSAFNQGGMFTITFDCMPQEWLKSGENEMSIDMQTTTYTDPVEVDIEYDDALVDNAVLTLSPVQDLNGQAYPWIDKVGRNKLNLVNMAKTETVNGITFTLTDEGKIYMNGTQDGSTTVTMWFPFASIETIPYGTYKISGLPSNMTFGDYGFSTIDSDQHITEHYENNSEVTDTIINFGVWVHEGVTVNNVELKPMIRESTDTSDVWQPYEHTSNICPIYPANGKNLFDEANATVYTRYIDSTSWRYSADSASYAFPCHSSMQYTVSASNSDLTIFRIGCLNQTFDPSSTATLALTHVTRLTSASSITVTTDAETQYIVIQVNGTLAKNAMIQIVQGDTVSPYVPYQSVNIIRTGKNIFDQSKVVRGSISGTGVDLGSLTRLRTPFIKVKPSTKYAFQCNSEVQLFEIHEYDENNEWQRYTTVNATSYIYTSGANAHYIKFLIRYADNSTILPSALTAGMVEEGDTESDFEPYQSNTYTSDLGQFVYGGTVDLVTGVLTINWAAVDMGDLSWSLINWNVGACFRSISLRTPAIWRGGVNAIANLYCSCYKKQSRDYTYRHMDTGICWANSGTNPDLMVRDTQFDNEADFKVAVTGQQLVYELATPQTYYLSAQDVSLLQGKNYFTAEQPLSVTITEGTTLTNPSYMKARPIIKLNNTGTGTVKLNGDVVVRVTEAPSNVPIYIDCENMNCYSYDEDGNVVNENGNVTLPEGYIEMEKGNNRFTATGQLEPTMIPRWWRL